MLKIEFIGGPYDGHKEFLGSGFPADELVWIVCEDAFRLLAGKGRRSCGAITSVAIYELEVAEGVFHYRFLGAKGFTDSVRATCIQMTNGGHK